MRHLRLLAVTLLLAPSCTVITPMRAGDPLDEPPRPALLTLAQTQSAAAATATCDASAWLGVDEDDRTAAAGSGISGD